MLSLRRALYLSAVASSLLVGPGCSDDTLPQQGSGGAGGNVADAGPKVPDECDPLVPTACALPFPSNRYLVEGGDTPTGRRVSFPEGTLPSPQLGGVIAPDGFVLNDGFSTGLAAMAHLPGATITGLPRPDSIERSLESDCPTVILDAETGERVPHFTELDMSHTKEDRRAFMIRPVVRLKDGTRYIVAIRDVVDAGGAALPPSPAFRALRDGTAFDHPSIEPRRALYDDLLARLESHGVARESLQLAWDFTTASREGTTRWALKMRDEALAQAGTSGPAYVIDQVSDNPQPNVARRIEGKITVPLYLDTDGPNAHLIFGADGLPAQSGTAEFGFSVQIPASVAAAGVPAPILQYGHGLLGGRGEIGSDAVRGLSDKYGYVVVATDWIGMAGEDAAGLANIVADGDISTFRVVPERSLQGFVNAFLAMRAMMGDLGKDPVMTFGGPSVVDPTRRFYNGNSQGGILGTCYMALSTDVTRGVLGVNGQPYNLLLNRSKDFGPFFFLLRGSFPDPIDQQIVLALAQMLWDRAEPTGYSDFITENMLPGTPAHEVLVQVAIGDHQVSTLGAHITARSVKAKTIAPAVRKIWGIEEATGPHTGSALVEFDFGLGPEPIDNVPPTAGDDPHERPRRLDSAQQQIDQFFRTGAVENFCGGPCVYPP